MSVEGEQKRASVELVRGFEDWWAYIPRRGITALWDHYVRDAATGQKVQRTALTPPQTAYVSDSDLWAIMGVGSRTFRALRRRYPYKPMSSVGGESGAEENGNARSVA